MSNHEPSAALRARWLVRPRSRNGYVYQFVVVWPGDVLGLIDGVAGALTFGFVRPNLSMKWMFRMAMKHSRWVRNQQQKTSEGGRDERA